MEKRDEPVESRAIELSVVIPAYNEATRLPRTLRATLEYLEKRPISYEVIVVDDGSRDDTTAVVQVVEMERRLVYGRIVDLRYETNKGKGHAVRYGVLRAKGAKVLFMDADLATPIEEFEKLNRSLSARTPYVIGSRPLKESQLLVRQPWIREMCGRAFNLVVQAMAAPGIHDTQCGFKLLTRDAAQEIFSRCVLDGFSFDVESIYVARKLGYGVAEIPVRWQHQEGAAAFSTSGSYMRHGIKMLSDLQTIRKTHETVRPVTQAASAK